MSPIHIKTTVIIHSLQRSRLKSIKNPGLLEQKQKAILVEPQNI